MHAFLDATRNLSLSFSYLLPFVQPPQKARQAETEKEDEKEDAEIVVRNKQEMISKPPPPPRKSLGLSTISKKVNVLHKVKLCV